MTRYKRRRIRAAIRCGLVLLLPLGTACIADRIPAIKTAAHRLTVTHSDAESVSCTVRQKISAKGSAEDSLTNEMILSHGYGVYVEALDPEVRLQYPLDMTAADPGPKPYPTQWSEGISIYRTTFGKYSGTSFFDLDRCGQVNNKSDTANSDLIAESRKLPDFSLTDTDEPQVLLYHTHTTETFEPFVRDCLDGEFNYRTPDPTKNMIMVGNAIQAELEAAGIGVIHVTEIHDYPSYNGSYGRSRESIVPILEQYPTIKVALDIHRDAIASDTSATQPYIEENGREAAQIMIISGCDDGTLGMPNYLMNFRFACALQQQIEGDHPGLTRPILFDYRHYNQDLTTGSLLIEVGSHGNTLEQAQYSGQLIGRSLSALLERMKE